MAYRGIIIEGSMSGQEFESDRRFCDCPEAPDETLRYIDLMGYGFWVIGKGRGNFEAAQKAIEILSGREWLEVAFKAGFRAAADYENLNRVSDADLEREAEVNWQEFRK